MSTHYLIAIRLDEVKSEQCRDLNIPEKSQLPQYQRRSHPLESLVSF